MQLKLKEDPKEWRNFALLSAVMLLALALLLFGRKKIRPPALEVMAAIAVATAILALRSPGLFRPVYRLGLTVSFRIGQVMQALLLTLVYFLVVLPLALVLRISGKDLLGI